MLINNYEIAVTSPACEPGAERYAAKAKFTMDISEVLPYLNAVLTEVEYHPGAHALAWKKPGHTVVFHAFEIAISDVKDRDGAEQEIKELVELVNKTWHRKDEITPSLAVRQRLTPMAIHQLLPRTNCKECGEPSCWLFAAKLATAQKVIADCSPLLADEYNEQRAALEEMVSLDSL
jgi:ArsR family metal-binding transcriptional regulator